MNTSQMVFELQGTVGELKSSMAQVINLLTANTARVEAAEKSSGEIKGMLHLLTPKLEDLAGFAKHRAPFLADKTDLATLKAGLETEIGKRPTRRQSVTDVALIVGLIAGLLAIGAHFAG